MLLCVCVDANIFIVIFIFIVLSWQLLEDFSMVMNMLMYLVLAEYICYAAAVELLLLQSKYRNLLLPKHMPI